MKNILILGGDADGNIGDAAILHALCYRIAAAIPHVSITIVSRQQQPPALPGVEHSIVPGPTGLRALLAAAPRQHLIIFGGGGLLQDDDSRAKVPYWACRLLALKFLQTNIAGLSVGVGPLQHSESRFFAARVCSLLRSISVRDEFARNWLERCTDKPVTVVPDPAFMLPQGNPAIADEYLRSLGLPQDQPLIGVTMRGWFYPRGGFIPRKVRVKFVPDSNHGHSERSQLTERFAAELRGLAAGRDAAVVLLPSYPLEHEGDLQACRALAERLHGVQTGLAVIKDPILYKAVTGRLSLMISARMHPLILAASMGVPIVGLAYNGKFDGLFRLLQLPYAPLDLNSLPQAASGWLEPLASTALEHCGELRNRCALLASQVSDHIAQLIGP